jgi:hypothetical protein
MKKLNRLKILSLALYYLFMPKRIRYKFYFKTSPIENLAVALIMNKIKYRRLFIRPREIKKKIIFTEKKVNDTYIIPYSE